MIPAPLAVLPPAEFDFFRPRPDFVKWMRGFASGSLVIDAGAGAGAFVRVLEGEGVKAVGLDIRPSLDVPRIQMADAQTFPYVSGVVVTLCRPCHGGWAPETARRALEAGAEVIYVGLDRNLGIDVASHPALSRTLQFTGAGIAGENAHLLSLA